MDVTVALLLGSAQCYISSWQQNLAVGLTQAQETQEQWKLALRFQKAMKKAMGGRVRFPSRRGLEWSLCEAVKVNLTSQWRPQDAAWLGRLVGLYKHSK